MQNAPATWSRVVRDQRGTKAAAPKTNPTELFARTPHTTECPDHNENARHTRTGFTSLVYQNLNRSTYTDNLIYDRHHTPWGQEGREFRWKIDHECVHGIRIQEYGNCYLGG
jgi:hypothetical protein